LPFRRSTDPVEFRASSTPPENAETRFLDASRVTSSGRDRFLEGPSAASPERRTKERREAGRAEAGAAKRKVVVKEALGGNGSGRGKSASDEGCGRETEAARSEAPPRRVRMRREKGGKEKETGVSAAAAVGASAMRRRTARRLWRMGGGRAAITGSLELQGRKGKKAPSRGARAHVYSLYGRFTEFMFVS
jgi:hypothetical protein